MNTPLISIIVPVYNVEKYLVECIKSVINQTFKDWELLLVDDGSSDRSSCICDEYEKYDSRIKVYHQLNSGVSKARFLGLQNSRGKYITFLDSDDQLPKHALYFMISAIGNADIVVGLVMKQNKQILCNYKRNKISANDWIEGILDGTIHSGPVAKLIKRECISCSDFDIPRNIVYAEDLIQNLKSGFRCKQIRFINEIVYIYRYNSNSVSNTFKYTLEYGNNLYDLVTNILQAHNFSFNNKSYRIFGLNILKHICLSDCYEANTNFAQTVLESITSDIWRIKYNYIWYFILHYQKCYRLYQYLRSVF